MAMVWEPVAPWLRDLNRLMTHDGAAFVPPADVIVTEDGVQVFMDVPGLRPEDIEIDLQNDVLTVRGERPWPYGEGEGEGAWRRVERGFGRFERSLRVPHGLNADQIQASLSDGVLSLRIPKPESLKPRRIQVEAPSAGEQQQVSAGQQPGAGQQQGAGQQTGAGQQVGAGQPASS